MVCMKSDEEKEGDNTYESEGSVEEVVSVSDEKYVYDGFGELLGAEGESEVTESIEVTGGDEVTESIEATGGDEVTESIEATGGDEVTESIEVIEGDEATESIEVIEGDEATESIEATGGDEATESIEAIEGDEATGGDEVTESIEVIEGDEVTESIEAIEGDEVTESIEATGGDEATESIEATGGDEVTESIEAIEGDEATESIEGGEDEKEGVFDSTYEGGMSDDIREDKSFVDIIDMNDSVVPMERDYTTTFTMDDDDMTASIIGKEISLYDDVLVDSVNEMDSFHLMNEGTATDDTLNQEEMPTDWMNENKSFCDSMTEEELTAFMELLEGNEGSKEEMLMHNEIEGYEEYWNDDMSMNAAMNEEDQLVLHENEINWSENESAFNQYDNSWNESEVRMMIGLTSRMNRLPFPSTW